VGEQRVPFRAVEFDRSGGNIAHSQKKSAAETPQKRESSKVDSRMTSPATAPAEPAQQNCETPKGTIAVNERQKAVQEFLHYVTGIFAATTMLNHHMEVRKWQSWCDAKKTTTLGEAAQSWPEYWDFRCSTTSAKSWKRQSQTHKRFWTWAVETGRTEKSPVKIPYLPPQQKGTRRPPGDDDFKKLMQPDFPQSRLGLCDMALMHLLASTGARIGEICGLTRKNLDLQKRTAIVTLKGGAPGIIYLHRETCEVVRQCMEHGRPRCEKNNSPDTVLLTNWGGKLESRNGARRIQKHCQQRGLGRITAHQLRHRFATKLLERGASLMEVQTLMNHKSLSSTLVYLHTTETQARAAHARLSDEIPKQKGQK
jgi:site-specific recombinase XerD